MAFFKGHLEAICENAGLQMPVYKREQEKAHNEVSILKQDYESTANGS